MKRALIITAVAAGAVCVSAAPAFAGLAGNASFSRHIPVPVPSGATAAHLTDDNHHNRGDANSTATSTNAGDNRGPGNSRGPGEAEPGDDRGNDNAGTATRGEPEPTDDRGGLRTSGEVEPGDDHGHDGATPTASATTTSGRGGSGGGDDGSRMGGHG
jgi:hypothetical protein